MKNLRFLVFGLWFMVYGLWFIGEGCWDVGEQERARVVACWCLGSRIRGVGFKCLETSDDDWSDN